MLFDVVYIEQIQPNGDILLVKKILNTDKAVTQIQPNGDILLKRIIIIKSGDLKEWDFIGSRINKVIIDNEIVEVKSYKKLYETIHGKINDGAKIIKYSVLNIKTIECKTCGFTWNPELGISSQGVNSNNAILEIVTQCEKNDIVLELEILINDQLVKINV